MPDGQALAKAREIADRSPPTVRWRCAASRRRCRAAEELPEAEAFGQELEVGMGVMASEDAKEGPRAFLEKRPRTSPARNTLAVMNCCHYHVSDGCDAAFSVDASRITFGRGCIDELGHRARRLGMTRVALFSDAGVARLPFFDTARRSLASAGLDVVTYTNARVEPTDVSFQDAARFAAEAKPDGYVSVGGGSVIDTAKAANLYATHPADFLAYVNKPVGEGEPVPGPLMPHIACPTTSGTGSEVTGMAIFDLLAMEAKTGIASPALRPTEALIDPDCTDSLPGEVVACSGLDVLSHALESYTARPLRAAPCRIHRTCGP